MEGRTSHFFTSLENSLTWTVNVVPNILLPPKYRHAKYFTEIHCCLEIPLCINCRFRKYKLIPCLICSHFKKLTTVSECLFLSSIKPAPPPSTPILEHLASGPLSFTFPFYRTNPKDTWLVIAGHSVEETILRCTVEPHICKCVYSWWSKCLCRLRWHFLRNVLRNST